MSITSITPNTETNKVYGFLKTPLSSKLIISGASFQSIAMKFMKADGLTDLVKEKKILEISSVSGNKNIVTGLELLAAEMFVRSSLGADTVSGAVSDTSQIAISDDHGSEIVYETTDSDVATVSDTGLITMVGDGTCAIGITVKETDDYYAQFLTVNITVS